MKMYRFDWNYLVTDELLARLARVGALPEAAVSEEIRPLIAQILASVGGLPLCEGPLDSANRTAIATRYLLEAAARFLTAGSPAGPMCGFVRQTSPIEKIGTIIVPMRLIEINMATRDQLAELPDISEVLAGRIVEERTRRGFFSDLNNLVTRVPGVGPERGEAMRNAVSFAVPSPRRLRDTGVPDLDKAFAEVIAACRRSPAEGRLAEALDLLATNCSREPHPATEHLVIRHPPEAEPPALDAAWVGLLENTEYYESLPALIGEAVHSIELCMFHIALSSEKHPTRCLLDALIAAKERGVNIRVLLDCDRREDPYKSTVINGRAKKYLEQHGIACRFDQPGRLLHSKYLIIDSSVVVLGSHNWSAGSYFEFDDLSIVAESPDLAAQLKDRFDRLWANG